MIQLKLITPTKTFVLDPLDGLTIPSNMQLNDNLQHQEAQLSVRVAYDVEVLNSLIENSELQAQLLDNNTPVFSGIIDTGVSWTDNGNPEPLDNIPIVINDNTYKLQQTTEDEFACINLSLAEITRRICLNCGLSFEENSKAESVIIPAFVLKAEQEYYQAFSDLLFEYKFTFGFTPDGKLCLIDLDAELDNIELSDLYSGVKVQKTKKKFTGVKLSYGKLTAKENEQIYFEGGNLNEDSKVVPYIITPGSYYPVEASPVLEEENGQVYQDFAQGFAETKTLYNGEKRLQRSQNTELIYSTNHYLVEDWTENLSVDRTDFKYTQASVRFYNASDTDAELRQLAIRATAYYRSDAEYILGTGKKYSYDTSYIYDTQNATNFADFLSKYFLGGNLKITLKTDKELTPGQKIKINTNTFSANVKVLAVNHNYAFKVFEITAITEQIVSLAVKKNQTQSSMSANQQLQRTEISAELIDSIIEEYYLSDSRTELINGTWQTTPVAPTNKQYVWTRTTFIYSDGSKKTTEPISVSGENGDNLESVDVEYAQNQTRTTAPTTGWQTTAPTAKDGYYIWTRTKVKIQNKEATYTQAVCITGDKGAKGADGKNAITMTSATTPNGEYNGQIGIWQGQMYSWNGTDWVLTSGILPTDPVLHYSFDELPEIPDGTAITHFKGDTYNLWQQGFWGNNVQTVSNNNGNIHVVANGQYGGVVLNQSYIRGNSVVVVVKVISGKLFVDIQNKHGMYQVLSQGSHTIKNYFSTNNEASLLFTTNSSDAIEFEIEEVYIGNASYTTPLIDNSGNNHNATDVKGLVTKGVSGKSLNFLKGNHPIVCENVIKNKNTNFSFAIWVKATEIGNYGLVGSRTSTWSNGWGLTDGAICYLSKNQLQYNASVPIPKDNDFHLIVGVYDDTTMISYLDGQKSNERTLTLFEGEQDDSNIYLGALFGGLGSTFNGSLDDFQVFDRALSDQEVLGLYLARGNTPKQFTLNDYRLNLIDDDGVISISEKKELLSRWKEIYNAENVSSALPTSNITATGEYKAIIDASTTQEILNINIIQNYIAATNAIRDAFWGTNGYLNNMDTPSTLTGSLDSLFATYRQTAQDANNAISQQQASKASAITVITSNEYTQLPVNESGDVTSYDYSGNTLQVLNGTTVLTPTSANVLADNQYKIIASGNGITAGSITVGTDKVTVGNSAAMTEDVAEITYTITVKVNGVQFTLYAVQKIAKASRGADARIYMLTTANSTVVKSPTGTLTPSSITVEAKSYLGSNVPAPFACDFYFYENNVQKQKNQSVTSASYSPTGNYPVVVKMRKPNTTTTATMLDQLTIPILNEVKGDTGAIYKGPSSTPPTTNIVTGDWYLDTNDNVIHWYNGSNWNNTVTDYNDYRYKPALNDMIEIAATNPNVPFLSVTNAWIKNLAAGNILADEIATQTLELKDDGVIKSDIYVEGESGFIIKSDGNVEFNKGRFRGGIGTEIITSYNNTGYINKVCELPFKMYNKDELKIFSVTIFAHTISPVNDSFPVGSFEICCSNIVSSSEYSIRANGYFYDKNLFEFKTYIDEDKIYKFEFTYINTEEKPRIRFLINIMEF